MKLIIKSILFISLLLFSTSTFARSINGKTFRAISFGELSDAKADFVDQTIIMKRLKGSYNKQAKVLPISGTFVAYLAKNNQILIWSKDSNKVLRGVWWVGYDIATKKKLLFCVDISNVKRSSTPCTVIKYLGDYIYNTQKGNVFNLKAGASVPAPLPFSRSISTIQDKIK